MSGKILNIINDENKNINEIVEDIEKIDNKIKFTVFGKTKPKYKRKYSKEISNKNEDILMNQAKKMEEEITKIRNKKLGRAANIFKLREVIEGPKKPLQISTAVMNPDNGQIIADHDDIVDFTLNYCVDNLSQNIPDTDVKQVIENRKLKQYGNIFNKDEDEEFNISIDDFLILLECLQPKKLNRKTFL